MVQSALWAAVELDEDGVTDPRQLLHIVGGEDVEHETAHGLDVAGGGGDNLSPSGVGQHSEGGASIVGAVTALDPAALLEAGCNVGHA